MWPHGKYWIIFRTFNYVSASLLHISNLTSNFYNFLKIPQAEFHWLGFQLGLSCYRHRTFFHCDFFNSNTIKELLMSSDFIPGGTLKILPYVGSDYFFGVRILNFDIFWGAKTSQYFLGVRKKWRFFLGSLQCFGVFWGLKSIFVMYISQNAHPNTVIFGVVFLIRYFFGCIFKFWYFFWVTFISSGWAYVWKKIESTPWGFH